MWTAAIAAALFAALPLVGAAAPSFDTNYTGRSETPYLMATLAMFVTGAVCIVVSTVSACVGYRSSDPRQRRLATIGVGILAAIFGALVLGRHFAA